MCKLQTNPHESQVKKLEKITPIFVKTRKLRTKNKILKTVEQNLLSKELQFDNRPHKRNTGSQKTLK